jgi:S-adenosylmethionine:tRNA ribosyltransferase-isomerase
MKTEEFDYHLPPSLIAQYPSAERGESRLMVLHREGGKIEHRTFREISRYFNPGDLLVTNNTRVLPARLFGRKETGGKCEVLLIPSWNGNKREWGALVKGLGKRANGHRIQFGQDLYGIVEDVKDGKGKISFRGQGDVADLLREIGHIPLPPYIKRADEPLDRARYQTIFAERDGAIAAPTAGLHFTHSLLRSIRDEGVDVASITLHVGTGTFAPVKGKTVEDHQMEKEWVEIPEETGEKIERTKQRGKRVIAVGTTTTRALESFSDSEGRVMAGKGFSSLFIHPPYRFRVVDALITNLHLPKSTLLMLVGALIGRDFLMKAYKEAVRQRYRFYSYGDAMLIL